MKAPVQHPNEVERQRILNSLALVFSPGEERFDRITRLAQRMFRTKIAAISLISDERQWFKSSVGLDVPGTPRDVSFCGHAILQAEPLVIEDAQAHPDFSDNPLVTGPPHVRFYAGHALLVRGQPIGTLCLIDDKAREFTSDEADSLSSLAAIAEVECASLVLSEPQQQVLRETEAEARAHLIEGTTQCWNQQALALMLPREIALSARSAEEFAYLHLQCSPDLASLSGLDESTRTLVRKEVARRIKRSLRAYDLVACLGDGRFAIYAPACDARLSELVADRIRSRIEDAPLAVNGEALSLNVAMGILTVTPGDDVNPARLSKIAEVALADALEAGKSFVRLTL